MACPLAFRMWLVSIFGCRRRLWLWRVCGLRCGRLCVSRRRRARPLAVWRGRAAAGGFATAGCRLADLRHSPVGFGSTRMPYVGSVRSSSSESKSGPGSRPPGGYPPASRGRRRSACGDDAFASASRRLRRRRTGPRFGRSVLVRIVSSCVSYYRYVMLWYVLRRGPLQATAGASGIGRRNRAPRRPAGS